MLNGKKLEQQFDEAFLICKMQASADAAFPEPLMEHWFKASWSLCAEMVGLVYPAREVTETVPVRNDGTFRLSYRPSGEVKLYSGATLVMVLPASLQWSDRAMCRPSLCCYCDLRAIYTVGEDVCEMPPRFVQAVARVFTYIAENRGDVELDREVLAKCGALTWLSPDLTYVL